MSKTLSEAIESGDDDMPEPPPPGGRNYITPEGLARLQDELKQLRRVERPKVVEVVAWAAGNGDRSENGDYIYGKKRLREIDRRIRFLMKRLEDRRGGRSGAPDQPGPGVLRRRGDLSRRPRDEARTVRIVGTDEARSDRGEVSWVSPVARALIKAYEGDEVSGADPERDRDPRGAGNHLPGIVSRQASDLNAWSLSTLQGHETNDVQDSNYVR